MQARRIDDDGIGRREPLRNEDDAGFDGGCGDGLAEQASVGRQVDEAGAVARVDDGCGDEEPLQGECGGEVDGGERAGAQERIDRGDEVGEDFDGTGHGIDGGAERGDTDLERNGRRAGGRGENVAMVQEGGEGFGDGDADLEAGGVDEGEDGRRGHEGDRVTGVLETGGDDTVEGGDDGGVGDLLGRSTDRGAGLVELGGSDVERHFDFVERSVGEGALVVQGLAAVELEARIGEVGRGEALGSSGVLQGDGRHGCVEAGQDLAFLDGIADTNGQIEDLGGGLGGEGSFALAADGGGDAGVAGVGVGGGVHDAHGHGLRG